MVSLAGGIPVNFSTVVRLHFLKATLSIGVLVAVSFAVGGRGASRQQNPGIGDCPTVTVSCPANVDGNSELHAYAATMVMGGRDKLKFQWTVTWPPGVRKGRIRSGQGTPSLVVSVPRRARGSITVTVKVIGWDPVCRNESSCSTPIGLTNSATTQPNKSSGRVKTRVEKFGKIILAHI